ncbi:pseudouridine synthase [Limtongia smithiae]|uniref:pseudouridine synthase n=1 Tax=Limtongia smithiae TaxID=1125753 RepID=UPI0034CE083E
MPPQAMIRVAPIPILFQCRHFLILNKPPFVYSQPTGLVSPSGATHVLQSLFTQYPQLFRDDFEAPFTKPKLVHRLDYGVSGAMMITTSNQAVQMFAKNLREGGEKGWPMRKTYLGVIAPTPHSAFHRLIRKIVDIKHVDFDRSSRTMTIDKPLADENSRAFKSTTELQILSKLGKDRFLVSLNPVTGRKHQLRRHCAEVLDAPIVGDYRYGYPRPGRNGGDIRRDTQLALHSYKLDFRMGLKWDSATAPILHGTQSIWRDVVDPQTGLLLENLPNPP